MTTSPTPNVPSLVTANHGVLVLTNDDEGPGMAAARATAADIASRCQVPLTLYDRSQETWGDTPHPEGPLGEGDAALDDAPHLRLQLRELQSHFDVSASAWIATLPSISSLGTALPDLNTDVVVVPSAMSRKLLETTLPGDSLAASVRNYIDSEEHINANVVEVADDGTIASTSA